ncbi:MAG: tyrosine--tRNA ligase [Bacteriovoracaceae bacterium]|nr:tyrosine--tRNA ligase [Bacteriovoracaceae bacterium]
MSEDKQDLNPEFEKEIERQLEILKFGVSEITPENEFEKMLRHSIYNNKPLRVKCGIDPTSTDVHLGHLVPYRKMRQFQDMGHVGVVIIGDFTASIGDPTGKNESRPPLSNEQIQINAKTYMEQLFTVLDREKTEIRFQSEWFDSVGLKDVISWAGQTTVAKLISHDTFKKRLEEGTSLSLHEMFYPILQGIDSVYVEADVELGGTDQKFNVLMGRDYQKNAGKRPQVAMLMPIVTGTCGTQKMSKSLDNYIGINDGPFEKFGKVMSIPDVLMLEYYKYFANVGEDRYDEIQVALGDASLHPNIAKKELASAIVSFFHGDEVGVEMRQQFENVFKKKGIPDDIPEFELSCELDICTVLTDSKLLASKGEARRMVKQNAVSIVDGDKITSHEFVVTTDLKGSVVKVGKRKFLKLI